MLSHTRNFESEIDGLFEELEKEQSQLKSKAGAMEEDAQQQNHIPVAVVDQVELSKTKLDALEENDKIEYTTTTTPAEDKVVASVSERPHHIGRKKRKNKIAKGLSQHPAKGGISDTAKVTPVKESNTEEKLPPPGLSNISPPGVICKSTPYIEDKEGREEGGKDWESQSVARPLLNTVAPTDNMTQHEHNSKQSPFLSPARHLFSCKLPWVMACMLVVALLVMFRDTYIRVNSVITPPSRLLDDRNSWDWSIPWVERTIQGGEVPGADTTRTDPVGGGVYEVRGGHIEHLSVMIDDVAGSGEMLREKDNTDRVDLIEAVDVSIEMMVMAGERLMETVRSDVYEGKDQYETVSLDGRSSVTGSAQGRCLDTESVPGAQGKASDIREGEGEGGGVGYALDKDVVLESPDLMTLVLQSMTLVLQARVSPIACGMMLVLFVCLGWVAITGMLAIGDRVSKKSARELVREAGIVDGYSDAYSLSNSPDVLRLQPSWASHRQGSHLSMSSTCPATSGRNRGGLTTLGGYSALTIPMDASGSRGPYRMPPGAGINYERKYVIDRWRHETGGSTNEVSVDNHTRSMTVSPSVYATE